VQNQNKDSFSFFEAVRQKGMPHRIESIVEYLFNAIGFKYSITLRQVATVLGVSDREADEIISRLVAEKIMFQKPKLFSSRSWAFNKEFGAITPEELRASFKVIDGGKK